jgi:hypothetical protein
MLENRVLWKIFGRKTDELTWGGEDYIKSSFMICTILTKYHSGVQIKKNKIGWTSGTYGRQERCTQGFGEVTRGKENTCKNQV